MHVLPIQNILDQQLKLLHTPGPTLSNFYSFDLQHSLFIQPTQQTKQKLLRHYKLTNIKTVQQHANNIFNIITYILFNDSIFQQLEAKLLLEKLKCTLYAESVDLGEIVGFQYNHYNLQSNGGNGSGSGTGRGSIGNSNLSNKNMKKILVQFFQITRYYGGNIQALLNKYQIVLKIFTLFYRVMLCKFNIKDAKYYNKQPNKLQALSSIFDYFQVMYQIHNNLIVFQNRNICILLQPKTNQIFIGQRISDISTKTSDFDLQLNQFGCDEVHDDHYKQSQVSAPTPCFGQIAWDQIQPQRNVHTQGIKQVDEELVESSSLKKLVQPLSLSEKNIHYDSQVAKDTRNFKVMLDSYNPNNSRQRQIDKKINMGKGSLKNLQKPASTKNKNPQKLNISDIHDNFEEQLQRKLTLSEKAGKKVNTIEDDSISMRVTPNQIKIKQNKLQSGVIQLKIQSSFNKKNRTQAFQEFRPKKLEIRGNLNIPIRKHYGKIPSFLIQKQQSQVDHKSSINPSSPLSMSPLHSNSSTVRKQYKDNKPKVNFTYSSNYKKQFNTSYQEPPSISTRPISGISASSVNYFDHEHLHPMSPPVTYRNSNIIRGNIIPGLQQYYYH